MSGRQSHPVSFAPRTPGGCTVHCMVWFDGEPILKIGCAHCSFVSKQLDLTSTYDSTVLAAAIESSRASHARLCARPRREPTSTRPRPQPSRSYRRAQ